MTDAVELAQVAAAAIAAFGLIWGVWSFRRSSRLAHYTELDRLYFDIVALRVAYPELGNLSVIQRMVTEQRTDSSLRYDTYALLMWNFIETIFDRCKQKNLLDTWKPILRHEGELHREWFADNLDKFKISFRKWASLNIPKVDQLVGQDGMLLDPVPAAASPDRPAMEALQYDAASIHLANRLRQTIATWEANSAADIEDSQRNWRIAEALHLATWHRPLSHAPLCLLLDEERMAMTNKTREAGI